jgi:hypothetical protein
MVERLEFEKDVMMDLEWMDFEWDWKQVDLQSIKSTDLVF